MSLRLLIEEDLPLVLSWRNAPEVRRNMYSMHKITSVEHKAWFSRIQDDPQSLWFIHEDKEGQPDGVVYFTNYQIDNGSAFWGFYAGSEAKRGVGTKMEFEALEKAFFDLGIHKLNCEVLATNQAVIKLHKKFGFVQEGIFRDFHFDGQSYIDVVRLGVLASEWSEKRSEIIEKIYS